MLGLLECWIQRRCCSHPYGGIWVARPPPILVMVREGLVYSWQFQVLSWENDSHLSVQSFRHSATLSLWGSIWRQDNGDTFGLLGLKSKGTCLCGQHTAQAWLVAGVWEVWTRIANDDMWKHCANRRTMFCFAFLDPVCWRWYANGNAWRE